MVTCSSHRMSSALSMHIEEAEQQLTQLPTLFYRCHVPDNESSNKMSADIHEVKMSVPKHNINTISPEHIRYRMQ